MELRNEKDARFIIQHHVTEEKLLHLEKGVRKLGFQSGGKRIMSIFLGVFLLCMAAKAIVGGTIGDALMMIGILCAMGFLFGGYALLKGWMDAKKQIHLQFEAGKMDDNYQWEYRFYDDGYQVVGKNEKSRVKYDNVGRLIDMSGMYVIVERGNVVRYFMKDDAVQGNSTELAGFLTEKCHLPMEQLTVR